MTAIGVTGHRGRLGSALVKLGCIPIDANVANYYDLSVMLEHLQVQGHEIETIVNCAAYTDVDGCEDQPMQAATVNVGGVAALARAFSGRIVYISTDYVFDGTFGPYLEDSVPNPVSVYGWSKLGGELVLKGRNNPDDLIVRTTVLFGSSDDFVSRVANTLLSRRTVALPDKLFGSPTYIPHLAEDILQAIDMGISGVLNLAGSRVISRYQFGRQIARALGLSPDLVVRGEVAGKAPRPPLGGLAINKALKLGLPFRDPYDGLKEWAERYKASHMARKA